MKTKHAKYASNKPIKDRRWGHTSSRPHFVDHGLMEVNIGAEYTDEELEFIKAVDAFKTRTGRRFPALTDYLDVLKSLGYQKE